MKKNAVIFNVVVSIIVLLLLALSVRMDIFFPTPETGLTESDIPVNVEIDTSMGTNPGAPIDLIEFGDYSCGFCRAVHPEVMRILAEYGDDINFVYRHMPSSDESYTAAVAAVCADEQGKFLEMHDSLFRTDDLSGNNIAGIAESVGIEKDDLIVCMNSTMPQMTVESGRDEANMNGIRGTPIFIINGDAIEGYRDYAFLKDAVEAQLDPEYIATQILTGDDR